MEHSSMVGAKTGVAACINEIESIWHIATVKLTVIPLKQQKIVRGSLDAAFELTKVIKYSMFLESQKKNKILSKKGKSF